jgi:hypothetical protein
LSACEFWNFVWKKYIFFVLHNKTISMEEKKNNCNIMFHVEEDFPLVKLEDVLARIRLGASEKIKRLEPFLGTPKKIPNNNLPVIPPDSPPLLPIFTKSLDDTKNAGRTLE